MSHSTLKRVLLSNPTLPDYGIDKEFAESDSAILGAHVYKVRGVYLRGGYISRLPCGL
jgi:hypothetical protein